MGRMCAVLPRAVVPAQHDLARWICRIGQRPREQHVTFGDREIRFGVDEGMLVQRVMACRDMLGRGALFQLGGFADGSLPLPIVSPRSEGTCTRWQSAV